MNRSDDNAEITKLREEIRLLTAWLDVSDQRIILMQRQIDNMSAIVTSIGRVIFPFHPADKDAE